MPGSRFRRTVAPGDEGDLLRLSPMRSRSVKSCTPSSEAQIVGCGARRAITCVHLINLALGRLTLVADHPGDERCRRAGLDPADLVDRCPFDTCVRMVSSSASKCFEVCAADCMGLPPDRSEI
jgi:hypothetical protein